MNALICPTCHAPLEISDQRAICRRCNKQYRLPPSSDKAAHQQDNAQPDPLLRKTLISPVVLVLAVAVCLVVFLVGLMIWLPSRGGSTETASRPQSVADETENSAVASPQVVPEEDDAGGLIDLSDLMELDDLDVESSSTESDESTDIPQGVETVDATPDVPGAFGGLPFVSLTGGQDLQIDGVPREEFARFRLHSDVLSIPVPAGRHSVRFPGREIRMIESSGFPAHYLDRKRAVTRDEALDLSELQNQLIAAKGVFEDPILPHLLGNAYWEAEHQESAIRFWNAAVLRAPGYAPSHLNLAYTYWQRGDESTARRELALATILNVQDTFGIGRHVADLASKLGPGEMAGTTYSRRDYLPTGPSTTNAKVVRVLESVYRLSDTATDRAACLNNVGIFLMDQADQPNLAAAFFIEAQQELQDGLSGVRGQHATTILNNLARSAKKAQLPEADFFRRLANSLH